MQPEAIILVPVAATPKTKRDAIREFLRNRLDQMDDRGSVNLAEFFTALGGVIGAIEALRRTMSNEGPEAEVAVPPAVPPTPAPTPAPGSAAPDSEPVVAGGVSDPAPAVSSPPPKSASKLKRYATAGAIVVGGNVAGFAVGTKISDVQSALHRVVPDIVCVSTPPPNTDVAGYLRIGSAAEQSAETILPLQPGQSCASPTVELSMHLETTLNPPDGACVDVRIDGEAVRSYVTLDVKQPSVDLRLREGTTCEPSKNTLVTVRELKRSNGLDR